MRPIRRPRGSVSSTRFLRLGVAGSPQQVTGRRHRIATLAELGTSPLVVDAHDVRSEVRWSCARCEVSAGQIDDRPSPLPPTWTTSEGLAYCLSCSRARAADEAMELLPETITGEARAKLRRKALIRFEISRSPDSPNRVIASACRTSTMAVAAVRDEVDIPLSTGAAPADN